MSIGSIKWNVFERLSASNLGTRAMVKQNSKRWKRATTMQNSSKHKTVKPDRRKLGKHKFCLLRIFYGVTTFVIFALSTFLLNTGSDLWQRIQTSPRSVQRESFVRYAGNTKTSINASENDSNARKQDFRPVKEASTSLFVYSAFLEVQNVIIIAIKERGLTLQSLFCVFGKFEGKGSSDLVSANQMLVVKASVRDLNDDHGLEFTAAYITCPLPRSPAEGSHLAASYSDDSTLHLPPTVGLAISDKFPLNAVVELPLLVPNGRCFHEKVTPTAAESSKSIASENCRDPQHEVEFTECLPALHSKFSDAAQVVEKIEMSRLLGVRRVVFYNNSISDNVDAVLRMYIKDWAEGRESLEVVVLPWKLPSAVSLGKIHNFGQMAAINDCLHRYRERSKFMTFASLNEHIIPRSHKTWSQFINHVQSSSPGQSGLLFTTTIFRQKWTQPAQACRGVADMYRSNILSYTQRGNNIFRPRVSSKMIVDPKKVEEMGVNFAWRMSGKTYTVPETDGLVHSYRKALPKDQFTEDEWQRLSTPVTDLYVVETFDEKLAARLKEVWAKLSDGSKPSLMSSLPESDHNFKVLEGIGSIMLVYSAIWEGSAVRIVAIKKLGERITNLMCVFCELLGQNSSNTVKATVKDLPEHHNTEHTAAVITCPISREDKDKVPAWIGLFDDRDASSQPKVILPIEALYTQNQREQTNETVTINRTAGERTKVEFTLCIPAMVNYQNAAQLVEKIEMSRLLGVRRVVFYNNSISENVDAVLRMYIKDWAEGRESLEVVVYPWQLPLVIQDGHEKPLDIHYFGQMASIDHCLHRYRRFTSYTIFSDLDEFIIPLRHNNLSQLISERKSLNNSYIGFMFQSTVFNHNRPSPGKGFEAEARRYGSAVLGLISRDDYFFPVKVRSKVIVDPSKVEVMGIHFIWKGSGRTDNVPMEQGMVSHYRAPLKICEKQVNDTRVVEKFGSKLVARLKHVWSRLHDLSLELKPFEQCERITECPVALKFQSIFNAALFK
ncbi:upf0392 protein f13g3.3-like isoform x1 [Plakobranchus ocellatus]|uniref:Upf0392 protein f13g3.3-like isoform x1 n=1 Tax=Plakobranchus ocellatus TaxID=259542 RepID=A0AAV4BGA2_9GAST|nr:upf0392 protein f13g3.3-like isoform x1 [Plakobranchus ocellatus]